MCPNAASGRKPSPAPEKAGERLVVAHGPALARHAALRLPGLDCQQIASAEDLAGRRVDALLLDRQLAASAPVSVWHSLAENTFIIADEAAGDLAHMEVPDHWPVRATRKALQMARRQQSLQRDLATVQHAFGDQADRLRQLTEIGIALSLQLDHQDLLERILRESCRLACSDAASLFLIERGEDGSESLIFKLTRNESREVSFEELRLPLDETSIAGYVASTGEEVNLDNAYRLPRGVPYTFNRNIDRQSGYRTASLLALPMRTPQQKLVGVLELINRKYDPDVRLNDPETTPAQTRPFSEDILPLLRALSSQAAVAIANNRLINDIERMFEGFVTASVTAIEQRDPTTSGHSFRVATFTNGLAEALPRSGLPRFRDTHFTDRQLRELRYASLLHDFGKVGVREHVLLKARKLPDSHFADITHRIELEKQHLRARALEEQLRLAREGRDTPRERERILDRLQARLEQLDAHWKIVLEANEPRIQPGDTHAGLATLREHELEHSGAPLLADDEYRVLTIPKGSLTEEERREIESHVTHTYNFLNRIPWPEDLARVPAIAAAHHEKLDGRGYPFGLSAEEIPFPSRLMTVSDIYDALTATDRPYKKAMPAERALEIIESEAKAGKLDTDLVRVFIEAEVYRRPE